MTPRILIVTDDADLESLLRSAMTGSGFELLLSPDGADGFRRAKADAPALLVVDANLAGLDGIGLVERIRGSEPPGTRVGIITIGGADPRVKLRALQSGADDFLAMPVHPVELMARVRRLLARAIARPSVPPAAAAAVAAAVAPTLGQVLAFYGAKGGVGTTTIAVNTAIALHRQQGRRVALVDANLQFGDHRVFLDVGVDRRSIIDAVSASAIDAELMASIMVTHASGVDLLLAPPSPEVADLVSAERHHLLQITEVLRTRYDYVVVDLDQRLDDHALDVLGIADRVMIVMNADLSCIKNVRLVVETMDQVGVPAERLSLVMNRSNAMTGVSVRSVEAVLKRPVEHMVVNDYRAAITGLNTGRPFQAGRVESGIGASIAEMARRLDGAPRSHVAAPSTVAVPTGLRALTAGSRA
jgi:pilus assembly protein CpaE